MAERRVGSRTLVLVGAAIVVVGGAVATVVYHNVEGGRQDQLKADAQGRQRDDVLNKAVADKGSVPSADGQPARVPPTTAAAGR